MSAKKVTKRKTPTRKTATGAKKATRRKTTARKKAPPKTVFDRLEDGVFGPPIRIANRTFLASLGLISTIQTEFVKFQDDFGKTFDELVKEGKKARDGYVKSFRQFRKDVEEEVEDTVVEVVEDLTELKDRIVDNVSAAVD